MATTSTGSAATPPTSSPSAVRRLPAGAVDVVEHQQRRPPRHPSVGQRRERRLRRARPGRVEHRAAVAAHLARQLRRQPRLAHPARARDQHEPAGAAARAPPLLAQRIELGLPARQRRAGVELGRQLDRVGRRRIELGVLAQDRLVQAPQLRAGLHADLLHQHRSRLAVGVERLRLPTAAIQGQHALRVQALPQRVLGHQRVELADDLAVPAGGQVTVDRQLERRDTKLVQTADLGRRERLVRHIRQRRAAPQTQRVARRARRDELLEAPRIQLPVAEPQLVTAPARDDLGAVATVGERLAQLRDVQLHHLGRCGRRLLTPEPPDEPIRRDRRTGVQRQQREQRPWLPRADEHRLAAGACLHGSENADVHIAPQRSLHEATVLPLPRHYRASTADLPPACSLLAIDPTDHPEEVTMKSHRRRHRHIRALALGLAACAALAAPAAAEPGADYPQPSSAKIGDTPADFAQPVAPAPKAGDTPVDDPGASRAPEYTAPTTIQVVRPERTIVRNVDEVLPVVLSSAALLLALGGCTFLLTASIRRRRVGRPLTQSRHPMLTRRTNASLPDEHRPRGLTLHRRCPPRRLIHLGGAGAASPNRTALRSGTQAQHQEQT